MTAYRAHFASVSNVSYLLSVPPVPTTNQKWGGGGHVPHGVDAYGPEAS